MSTPIKTTIEARIAHVVGVLIGVGFAVAGFLANHKGVQIPCTGLTVGGAIAGLSHFRYLRVVEQTVASAVAWEKENKDLGQAVRSQLPPRLYTRLIDVEDRIAEVTTTAQEAKSAVENAPAVPAIEQVAAQVLSLLAKGAAQSGAQVKPDSTQVGTIDPAVAPFPTNGPVPVEGSGNITPQAVESVPASKFQNPPIAPQTGQGASV